MKILYIHGLSSSGNSGTAERLRRLLPDDIIFSPDLPVEPLEALEMLKQLVTEEGIELMIGTSMGGMFAQKLRGIRKILVNPSFHVSQSMRRKLGVNKFFSERQDGFQNMRLLRNCVTGMKGLKRPNACLIRTKNGIMPPLCSELKMIRLTAVKNIVSITPCMPYSPEGIG